MEVWCASGQHRDGKNCHDQPIRSAYLKIAVALCCHASSLCRAIPMSVDFLEYMVDGDPAGAQSPDPLGKADGYERRYRFINFLES
jgi:hypothetical protein